jgi:AcrR family transcriptional regulator
MPVARERTVRKRRDRYHHGDLRRALVHEAVRTIQAQGVEALTLRVVGQRLGVSRTALYRHFSHKSALLAAVAREGFRTLKEELDKTMRGEGDRWQGFEAMGRAYVRFAVEHPAHYRVMFGGFLEACQDEPDLLREAGESFQVLVDALTLLQRAGQLRHDDSLQMARYVWAIVHGISMLIIDGQLRGQVVDGEVQYAIERLKSGIAAQRDLPDASVQQKALAEPGARC